MRMAPFACFFLRFLSVSKPKEVFKTLIFVPTSLPTDVKHHLAGSATLLVNDVKSGSGTTLVNDEFIEVETIFT